ncbi:MAG: RagB/SusD family nutrient uptake outer membrane protein [Bacteroidaceae bacterium]|nr:RagB/SusD family nutrient uptake outer membrane protein [Bacteroidaceae bacterium]
MLSLGSCADWFDISPKTDVKAEDLFETENGFLSSLAGIYVLMTNEAVYGRDLSFGLVEQLAQMYDVIPEGANSKTDIYNYNQITSGGYNTKGNFERTWLAGYNIIANANNLFKWLDQKGDEVIRHEETRNMIRGEALAIRAALHFDLLRLWGPANYATSEDARKTKCIPYRTVADKEKLSLLEAQQVVANIIADLDSAKQLLSYESNLDLSNYSTASRRFRFNYHAVNALLARVHNYAGNSEQAKAAAIEVIDNCGLDLKSGNDDDPILFDETLCAVNLYQMKDNLSTYFDAGDKIQTKYHVKYSTLNAIFEISGSESEDMRARSAAFARNSDYQMAVTKKYQDNDNEAIPLLRLPEMYYIVCENSEGDEAAYYINLVRNRRGISSSKNVVCDTQEQRVDALLREYRKEFYAEGQFFYFLKSHGVTGSLVHSPEVSLTAENFVLPLPDAEREYGWTDDNDNDESVVTE